MTITFKARLFDKKRLRIFCSIVMLVMTWIKRGKAKNGIEIASFALSDISTLHESTRVMNSMSMTQLWRRTT